MDLLESQTYTQEEILELIPEDKMLENDGAEIIKKGDFNSLIKIKVNNLEKKYKNVEESILKLAQNVDKELERILS
jgi:GTP-dependent phosphoenolpyruvate carboxykinase